MQKCPWACSAPPGMSARSCCGPWRGIRGLPWLSPPRARRRLIDPSREVVIDAASGVTGAGRNPSRELLFGEVAEDYRAYAVGNTHRHLPEVRATLERESGFAGDLVFTPHLLPVKRGILETIHVPLTGALHQDPAEGLYEAAYRGAPCVQVFL